MGNPLDDSVALLTGRTHLGPRSADTFDDPALDVCSVAAAGVRRCVVAPDPDVEVGLDSITATITASGTLSWRVRLRAGWRRSGGGPVVAAQDGGFVAMLPSQGLLVSRDAGTPTSGRTITRLGRGPEASAAYTMAADLPADTRWWRLLSWSLRRRRADGAALLLLAAIGGLTALLLPLATATVFGSAVPQGDGRRATLVLVAFAIASVAAAVVMVARGMLIVRLRDSADALLSPALMARMLRLSTAPFRRMSVGDITNRVLSVESSRQQVDDSAVAVFLTSIFGLVNLGFLLAADLTVGLVTGASIAAVLAVSLMMQTRARRRLAAVLETRSRSDATLLAILGSLVSWRVAGAEDRALARWAREQGATTRALSKRVRAIAICAPIDAGGPVFVLAAFTIAVVVFPGAKLLPGSAGSPGVFLAMYAAVAQLTITVMALTDQFITLSELGPTMQRLRPIADSQQERQVAGAATGRLHGEVSMSGVVFGYNSDRAPLFDGLSMTVSPGEFVAIVGPSGAGKSSLLRLLLGFETPWQGTVNYDGRDLAGLAPGTVRRQLGVVLQSSRPIGATIRQCVAGPRVLSDDHIWALLEQAGLDKDVAAMTNGLDADVGQAAAELSGGQRQRLSIAAALAGDPRILLFDEATSALDNLTQAVVMRTILDSAATRIVIAHRMSTIRQADRILVVSDGRIAEEGTPDALLVAGGVFAALAARQQQ